MSLDVEYARRRRRIRPDDVGTVPVPHVPLADVARRWHEDLAQRDRNDQTAR